MDVLLYILYILPIFSINITPGVTWVLSYTLDSAVGGEP